MTRLTNLAIQRLPVRKGGQKTYWDDVLPAFGIRVGARAKSFVIMYGKDRRLKTIGRYPQISLSDARKEARRLLAQVSDSRPSPAYREAKKAFLDECKARLRPRTVEQYRRYLDDLTFAGDVGDITRQRLAKYLASPHASITFKVFFNWCIKNDLIDRNPVAGERISYGSRSRVLTAPELAAVWHHEDGIYTDIVKLLILTGQRKNEIASLQQVWIQDGVIVFPSAITKNKREHMLPYGELTARYLQPRVWNGWSKSKKRMDDATGVEGWTLHDLRRTFATIHAELGTPIHVTEKLLNHTSGTLAGVAGIYNRHTYLPEMRQAVETYEAHIARIVGLGHG